MAVHESAWGYRRFRWLKAAVALVVVSAVVYAAADPAARRGGDTVVGYALGGICAALVLWLTWFGVRKRSYHSAGAPLRGWLSAHVYLGAALVLLVPLHCAFQFGINVHTLAYVLMTAVVISGVFGVGYYTVVPELITENRPGDKLAGMFEHIAQLDGECRSIAETLPDVFALAVETSIEQTKLGGSLLRQLSGTDPHCGTGRALEIVAREAGNIDATQRASLQRLLEILGLKRSLVATVRHEIRYKALLGLWLALHVPLAVATLVAVAAHVVLVFLYR